MLATGYFLKIAKIPSKKNQSVLIAKISYRKTQKTANRQLPFIFYSSFWPGDKALWRNKSHDWQSLPHPASYPIPSYFGYTGETRAFDKLLGNCLATFRISSNLFSFRATFCILSNFSSNLLILRYRSSFKCLNWPFSHISRCFSRQFMNFL